MTEGTVDAILATLDHAGVGYAVCEADGRLADASSAFLTDTGLTRDVVGSDRPWFELDASSSTVRELRRMGWRELSAEARPWKGWVKWTTPDGDVRFFEGTARKLTDGRVILIANDRSDRIAADHALSESEDIQASILDALPLSVALQDENERILYTNPYVPDRLGIPRSTFIGRTLAEAGDVGTDPEVDELTRSIFHEKREVDWLPIDVRSGTLAGTSWLFFARPIRDRNGVMRRFLTIAIDRTQEAAFDREREGFARALAETQKISALNDFAGSLAHELSNILHPVGVYARALARDPERDDRAALASKMNAASMAAGRILSQTLRMARHDREGMSPQPIAPLVSDVVDVAGDLAPAGLRYESNLDPSCIGCVQPTEFRQVLLNLLNNAAEAQGQKGRILIRLEAAIGQPPRQIAQATAHGGFLRLSVKDEGPGMVPETAMRVFEPFFTTKPGCGTGLGLPVVLGLVTGWGGTVAVDTQPGEGSTFSVWIPRATARCPASRQEHP